MLRSFAYLVTCVDYPDSCVCISLFRSISRTSSAGSDRERSVNELDFLSSALFPSRYTRDRVMDVRFLFVQVLQRDIEAHGRIVSSVVKLGDKVFTQQQQQQREQEQQHPEQQQQHSPQSPLRTVRSLERRWHLLFLRALEWQCHIESLASHIRNKVSPLAVIVDTFFLFCEICSVSIMRSGQELL